MLAKQIIISSMIHEMSVQTQPLEGEEKNDKANGNRCSGKFIKVGERSEVLGDEAQRSRCRRSIEAAGGLVKRL